MENPSIEQQYYKLINKEIKDVQLNKSKRRGSRISRNAKNSQKGLMLLNPSSSKKDILNLSKNNDKSINKISINNYYVQNNNYNTNIIKNNKNNNNNNEEKTSKEPSPNKISKFVPNNQRLDKYGNAIKHKGKQKICFIDQVSKKRLVDVIKVESFKEYNFMEEVKSKEDMSCCCILY